VIKRIKADKKDGNKIPLPSTKIPNHLLSVVILLITVTPFTVPPPMNYPVKDNSTTPKQAS
jgi:hypothetical protein